MGKRRVRTSYPREAGDIILLVRDKDIITHLPLVNFPQITDEIVEVIKRKTKDKRAIIQLHQYDGVHAGEGRYEQDHLHIVFYTYKDHTLLRDLWKIFEQYKVTYTWERLRSWPKYLKYLNQEDKLRTFLYKNKVDDMNFDNVSSEDELYIHDENRHIPEQEIVPAKKAKVDKWDDTLRDIIRKYKCIQTGELKRLILQYGTAIEKQWLLKYQHTPQMSQKIHEELENERLIYQKTKWEDILDTMDEDIYKYHCNDPDKVLSINVSKHIIKAILMNNGYDVKEIIHTIWEVVNNISGKINTIYILGEKNAGKTLFALSIARSLIYYASLSKYGTSGKKGDDRFMLSHCIGCRLILGNEAYVSDDNMALSLNLFEGNPQDVDVKFKNPQRLNKTPVIVTNNNEPCAYLGSFSNSVHRDALLARMKILKFKTMPQLAPYTGWDIHPAVWKYLLNEYIGDEINKDVNSFNVDDLYDEHVLKKIIDEDNLRNCQ